jgi:hypothetical protein
VTLTCCIAVTLLTTSSWMHLQLEHHAASTSMLVEDPVAAEVPAVTVPEVKVARRPGPPMKWDSVPLARLGTRRVPAPKDAADTTAAQATVGTPGPALSSRRCRRMEAWGDVCVYKNICMGDGRLKFFVEKVESPEMQAGECLHFWCVTYSRVRGRCQCSPTGQAFKSPQRQCWS